LLNRKLVDEKYLELYVNKTKEIDYGDIESIVGGLLRKWKPINICRALL
jgi:hypothetical protein